MHCVCSQDYQKGVHANEPYYADGGILLCMDNIHLLLTMLGEHFFTSGRERNRVKLTFNSLNTYNSQHL
jgi:hypothetical protein